jgi:DNA-binding transcriptional MerR regulator
MAATETASDLTIDQLAQATGMTARNIRAHQSRGLLPPPEVRGRTGYYGQEHAARIALIQELQADGFNLELIRRLLDSAEGSGGEVLNFTRALRMPFADEQPEIVDVRELAEQWQTTDPSLLGKAESLGLIRNIGDGRYELPSPRLARAGAELAALGVPGDKALELAGRLRRRADDVAELYTRLFLETIWKPFEAAGHPDERWPEIQAALERLRPLAAEALLAAFQLAMDDAIETAFGRVLSRMERRRR